MHSKACASQQNSCPNLIFSYKKGTNICKHIDVQCISNLKASLRKEVPQVLVQNSLKEPPQRNDMSFASSPKEMKNESHSFKITDEQN